MRKFVRYASVALAFAGIASTGSAQLNLNWEELGPNNLGDHTRAMLVDASGNVWAGAAGGGLWKSTNSGSTWSQVSGVDDNLVVSSIAVNGSNIYVATGEVYFQKFSSQNSTWRDTTEISTITNSFHQSMGMPGQGVFVSNDGGNTWSNSNFFWNGQSLFRGPFISIQKVAVNGGRTFVATLDGLYYSDDANLANATKVSGTSPLRNKPVVEVVSLGNNVILAATKDSLYRSTDNGATFGAGINAAVPTYSTLAQGRLAGDRIVVAPCPNDANIVYLTAATDINGGCTGVWRSNDAGVTWTRVAPNEAGTFTPFGSNGRYACILAVDPTDNNSFYVGGKDLFKYTPTTGIQEISLSVNLPGFTPNYVPSPMLSMAFNPSNGEQFYVGTDREIMRTDDAGETFLFKTKGLNAAHAYSVQGSPNYEVFAFERYNGLIFKDNGNSAPNLLQWTRLNEDVKGVARVSLVNLENLVVQGEDQGLLRSLSDGASYETFYGPPKWPQDVNLGTDSLYIDRRDSTVEGAGVFDGGAAPITPWCLDEVFPAGSTAHDSLIAKVPSYVYMCSRHFVWLCTNPFGTLDSLPYWNRISLDLIDDNAQPREYFTAIEVSGDNNHVVYVGTTHGKIYRIYNANDPANMNVTTKATRIDQAAGLPSRWVTDFAFDPRNPNNLVITYGGYEKTGDSRVYLTNNALDQVNPVAFRSIGSGIGDTLPAYTAAFHPTSQALLVGTEKGLFTTTDDWNNNGITHTWTNESGTMGNAIVYDINIRPYYRIAIGTDHWKYGKDGSVFVATYGRGIFRSNTLVSKDDGNSLSEQTVFELFPNPTADISTIRMTLPAPGHLNLQVFTLDGRQVDQISDRELPAGMHSFDLHTRNLTAGVYLVKAAVTTANGTYNKTLKAVVVK